MIKKDWLFSDENNICNFRAVGVLIRNKKLLVQIDKDGVEYALPGGHVKVSETSEKALIREFKEETGADILCERLIWVEETFWKSGAKNAHGLAFYYLISLKNNTDIPDDYFDSQKDNRNVILKWVSLEQIKQLTIYPTFLKEKIEYVTDNNSIEHFISHE